ncbi:MAG TPA: respiratory nitrate reductase subunit gamma [Steroidobacteraceae bacterium]|nr:respiratory nitrate reductase subunit gamma [Steroidobacteraceae bacterium]
MSWLDEFFFGVYPYIAGTVFLLGSLVRFDRDPYTWKSESSEILKRGNLRLASNCFHIGVLFLFFGHLIGLLAPEGLFDVIGLGTEGHELLAMVSGGVFGVLCWIGIVLLIYRRLSQPRIRVTSSTMDLVVVFWIFVTLSFGLSTIAFSAPNLESGTIIAALRLWAQHIVTFHPVPQAIGGLPVVYQIHLVLGMTLFALVPFSRLVHIWSGFASVFYLLRPYQVVRPRAQRP